MRSSRKKGQSGHGTVICVKRSLFRPKKYDNHVLSMGVVVARGVN